MKKVIEIEVGKFFFYYTSMGKADFVRIDPKKHHGNNAKCMKNREGTFQKNMECFILWDEKVVPVVKFE